MLPKVATHLLHTTTRSAAAAVHNQSGTLRNVLQSAGGSTTGATPTTSAASPSNLASGSATNAATSKTIKGAKSAEAVKPVTIAVVTASGSSLVSAAAQASASGPSSSSSSKKSSSHNPNFFDSNTSKSEGKGSESGSNGGGNNGSNNPKAGRRFYTNYNGASRAVTQANAIIIAEDASGIQHSTADDLSSAAYQSQQRESRRALLKSSASKPSQSDSGSRRTRLRSSSVNALLPRNEGGAVKDGAMIEKMSVLKTVQLQARSFHVLASAAKAAAASPTATSMAEVQQPSLEAAQTAAAALLETEVALTAEPLAASTSSTAIPIPRPTSPLATPRSPRRRSNSVSSRPGSPILLLANEDITRVELHLDDHSMLARHNSTSSVSENAPKDAAAAPPSPSLSSASASGSEASVASEGQNSVDTQATSVDSAEESSPKVKAATQRVIPRVSPMTEYGQRIVASYKKKDIPALLANVRALTDFYAKPIEPTDFSAVVKPSPADFNVALNCLSEIRQDGESITPILDVYNTMLFADLSRDPFAENPAPTFASGIKPPKPNLKTYILMIDLFTKRDWELHRMIVALTSRASAKGLKRAAGLDFSMHGKEENVASPFARQLAKLKAESESHFKNAMKLFSSALEVGGRDFLDHHIYKHLLRSTANHGDVKAALWVFGHLERLERVPDYLRKTGVTSVGVDSENYRSLVQAFTNNGDYEGAEMVFDGFKKQWKEGKIFVGEKNTESYHKMQVSIWNQMIEVHFRKGEPEKAVEVLDSMLKASSSSDQPENPVHNGVPLLPSPASSTFTTIIGGFIQMGDIQTAYAWFRRLLDQPDTPGVDPLVGLGEGKVMKPDQVAWSMILDALASAGKIQELNGLYLHLVQGTPVRSGGIADVDAEEPMSLEGVKVLRTYRHIAYVANMESLKDLPTPATPEQTKSVLDQLAFVKDLVLPARTQSNLSRGPGLRLAGDWDFDRRQMFDGVCKAYVQLGHIKEAYQTLEAYVKDHSDLLADGSEMSPQGTMGTLQELQRMALVFWGKCFEVLSSGKYPSQVYPWSVAIGLARLTTETLGLKVTPEQAVWLLQAYGQAAENGLVGSMSLEEWRILLGCAVHVELDVSASTTPVNLISESGITQFSFKGTASLLQDLAQAGVVFNDAFMDVHTRLEAVDIASRGRDAEWSRAFFAGLGESYLSVYNEQVRLLFDSVTSQMEAAVPQQQQESIVTSEPPTFVDQIHQHASLSRDVDAALKNISASQEIRTENAYALFRGSLESKQMVPHVATLGRLIQACGRLSQLDRVREVYQVSQALISNLRHSMGEGKRRELWVQVEDSMVIALAHAGDVEGAHIHRLRILDFGKDISAPGQPMIAPSADAYGALILNVKDTTDDASNSLMLWNEAMKFGVSPNLYLYNNIISKLSRARKADYALDLFHAMRAGGIYPSSITYGAVIGACARVGDVASAETLFREMTEQRNFKARVPPFNTMMQVYTTTKPSRDRALWFYQEMKKAGVNPTAHTYKLLLDVYGSVEPLDIASMEVVFEQLKNDRRVHLQGTHFASLINAYGCVLKDLDKAIAAFESISSYTVQGMPLKPDAVVYEAVVNALVANKRTDLIPSFMERMSADQVHMTAYVANFLIKGYANVGDIEHARSIFESMLDPPTGVAAPHNHAPHDPALGSADVPVMEPVYREPSTWEAMIRAELGAGYREQAFDLLERLKVRQYPEAVFNRISGVLVDHSAVIVP
ncbi:hypothetical protein FA15DRAFT_641381 [Coprinopsis marcescibilis]|uniref:PROP1-like PPR domain-containing protein n=1 Tax=Coprinopsis marcescibilis TaxID=230819 RepID=A0A5C3KUN2_COPMA|nr:hypothetical protein FA15DRAFT_641381 [Coprinopsis marcescibilis]